MAQRIIALWGDDWELRGNGFGHVAHLQYLPARFLFNLARDFEIPLTFFVETMQQLAFEAHAPAHRDLAVQRDLWRECVTMMLEEGHDVQLHIHPHWRGATYEEDAFRVGKNWNLATWPEADRRQILAEAYAYLSACCQAVKPDHRLHTYKAGAWALSPSAGLLRDLADLGIRCAIGVSPGMYLDHPEFQLDYRHVEEETLPWRPDPDEVCRVGNDSNLPIILPAAHYQVDLPLKAALILRKARARFSPKQDRYFYHRKLSSATQAWSPLVNAPRDKILRKLLRPYRTHLDLGGGQSFFELRRAFDQIVERLRRHPAETVPLVIESHSKMFEGHWATLHRFIGYVREDYPEITFQTMTAYLDSLETDPKNIRTA